MRERFRFVARAAFVFVGIPLLPMLISGRWDWTAAWVFFVISAVGAVGSRLLLFFVNPELITERNESFGKENVASWDKVLAPLMGFGGLFIPLVAGFEARDPRTDFPVGVEIAAAVLMTFGYAFGTWAMVANRFFSGTVRLQEERGHAVQDGGPYRFVRHPGYLGALAAFLGGPFLLDSAFALIPAALVLLVTVVRTHLEDHWLHENLEGYAEFAKRTRSKLVPFVW